MESKKTGVKIFLLFFIIAITSSVIADPPFLSSGLAEESILIESPSIEYIKVGEDFQFHVHAHNSSDGVLMTNATTDCIIHIYSGTKGGVHIIQDDMGWDGNDIDFMYTVGGGNFTEGSYAVLFYCEAPGEIAGFLEYSFFVNNGGDSNVFILVTDIFMICLIVFFFTMIVKKFGDSDFEAMDKRIVNNHEDNWMKTFARSFGYGLMKNAFLWYYLGGWFLLFFIRDIMYRFGSTELYNYMILIFDIYSFGFILVIAFFIGMIYKHFENIRDIIDDISRGVN